MLVVHVVFQRILAKHLTSHFVQEEELTEKRGEDTDHDGWEVCTEE